jgi:dTMP kinase
MPRNGLFIVIEGNDGAGKTTVIENLVAHLKDQGLSVIQTREPGGTDMGQEIRQTLLTPRDESVTAVTEMLLFAASREQSLHTIIEPALERGDVVICDRWETSTFAYQAFGSEERMERFSAIKNAVNHREPDRIFLLDVDLEVSKQRRRDRGEAADRMELKGDSLFKQVQSAFRHYANEIAPDSTRLIDANQPVDHVLFDITHDPVLESYVKDLNTSFEDHQYEAKVS